MHPRGVDKALQVGQAPRVVEVDGFVVVHGAPGEFPEAQDKGKQNEQDESGLVLARSGLGQVAEGASQPGLAEWLPTGWGAGNSWNAGFRHLVSGGGRVQGLGVHW